MSLRLRMAVFGAGVLGFAAVLVWGLGGLPNFGAFAGRYGQYLAHHAVPERHATSSVSVTTFDFRGVDTLIEEFILFTAAVGVVALLRVQRASEEVPAEPESTRRPTARSGALRSLITGLVAPTLVLGVEVVIHGHLTPGGGFQGGVILMTALFLVYLAGAHLDLGPLRPMAAMEASEGLGAAGFALIGLAGLVIAGAYVENFLPFGSTNHLVSGGDIPLLNIAVGLGVMGALLIVVAEFLDQRLLMRRGKL